MLKCGDSECHVRDWHACMQALMFDWHHAIWWLIDCWTVVRLQKPSDKYCFRATYFARTLIAGCAFSSWTFDPSSTHIETLHLHRFRCRLSPPPSPPRRPGTTQYVRIPCALHSVRASNNIAEAENHLKAPVHACGSTLHSRVLHVTVTCMATNI